MTKSDLKTGMLIECRNGDVYLIVGEFVISNNNQWFELWSHEEDLTYIDHDFDIVRVSEVLEEKELAPKYWTKETITNNLLWERPTIKETIKIGNITYDKQEFENAVKDLKPIK